MKNREKTIRYSSMAAIIVGALLDWAIIMWVGIAGFAYSLFKRGFKK